MAEMTEREKLLAYLKKVSADLFETRERLRKLEAGDQEPIAIIGMGCRYPGGVQDPDGLWDLVATGSDAVSGFPENRGWDIEPAADEATSFARAGGFIADIAGFDAGFFGISPREALATDPQQRILLEVSWEALERAGLNPHALRGTRTGVFVGGAFSGYTAGMTGAESEGYLMTGGLTAVISGRVSYTLGLEGPAVTLDTACSSSLVALHLACQSLRSGESTLALAGGVSLLVIPVVYAEFSKQQGMAADGRCKPFAGAADGIGWGEGAGMVVLEKLSDAQRNGHQVLAVIAGSAANQDGASNGLTAPNGPSQRRVIRAALASARLTAEQVDAVEAHGTGTTLGDPIEAQALLETYGQGRPEDRPLWLGSVKSNIGHSQSAAGVAGVMKMVLALRHGLLPKTLHVDEPTPHVDWTAGGVQLLTEPLPWPAAPQRPRRAGVSAFGVSGTNVHLILEEAPANPPAGLAPGGAGHGGQLADSAADSPADSGQPQRVLTGGPTAWLLSGRSPRALAAQAARLAAWAVAQPGLDPADAAWALATTRAAFEQRAVVIGTASAELAAGAATVAAGQPAANATVGAPPAGGDPCQVVFVFPGQGSQWAGMGTELAASSPVFATRLAECSRALEPHTGWKLADVLAGTAGAPALDRVDVVQPALWAVMVSLAAVWQAAGIKPDAVAGHSQGEIAAAVVAGILSLDDAAKVVALRSRALTALSGRGAMASLALPAARVRELLADPRLDNDARPWPGRAQVAAVNGPSATVVSGDPEAVAALVAACEADDVRARMLPVDYASHGPQVAELEDEILAALAGITPRRADIPMMSAMTGEYLTGPEADAAYWYASLRAPVEFERSVRSLARDGHRLFIETSPHPVLTSAVTAALEEQTAAGTAGATTAGSRAAGTLRRDDGGPARLLTSLAEAYVHGASVDWTTVLPQGRPVDLPTYAFQHQRYWVDPVNLTGNTGGPEDAAAARGPGATGTRAEAEFWSAVDSGDTSQLARVLGLGSHALSEVLPALASWRRREHEGEATAAWRYRVTWTPVADSEPHLLNGSWLLVTPAAGQAPAAALTAALTARGAHVVTVTAPAGPELDDASHDGGTGRAALAALIGAALADETGLGAGRLAGVLCLLPLDETPLPQAPAVPSGLAGTLGLVQALGDLEVSAPLWVVTAGAVGAVVGEVPARPVQAQAWGLGRTAGVEHPDRWGGLIDLHLSSGERALDERTAAAFCAALAGTEDEIAIRPAGTFARRLVRAQRPAAPGAWRPRGTVLVTGASGSIGPDLAHWLAACGSPRVVLAGRRGPHTPGAAALAAQLAHAGTDVRIAACDITDREPAAGLLAWSGNDGPAVSTVIHAAVAVDLEPVAVTTLAGLSRALGAKAAGAAILDELTAPSADTADGVADFVLFSSIAATWGVAEHGAYGAANAYLDALAQQRRARGLPATSVAWGVWSSGGKFDEDGTAGGQPAPERPASVVPQRLARQGLRLLDPAQALSALSEVLAAGETALAVADVDWERFAPVFTAARPWRLLDEIPQARQETASAAATDTEFAAELARLGPADRERAVTALIRTHAAATLGHPSSDAVEAGRAFRDLGFDSLTAIELRNRLNAATGLTLPSTVVFDHPSPLLLARQVLTLLSDPAAATAPASRTATGRNGAGTSVPGDPVAIIGMGCRFPGGADTPEALWSLLESGGDAVGGFPRDRGWDVAGLFDPDPDMPGTSYTSEGGFVAGAGDFDPGFFGISPREALAMDPQQRLLLETAWEAVERAGIAPAALRGSRTGVFAGAASSGYGGQAAGEEGTEAHLITGNVTSVISGRISYVLGLEGPAVTVDTACSSALVALHLAAQSLRSGECDLALAGGVMVIADPAEFVGFSRQRALAADGRCKAFAASADGMGLAEGAGMIALERLSDARRNGHHVIAVVAGSAINQDGASNGLTAPHGPSQQRVIAAALDNAGLEPADIDAVEGHGTGTTLGDPIEAQALIAAYGHGRPEGRPLWLGSVKSNIGHAQQASGAASLIKMALALQHGLLPATLHVDQPTPHVDWAAGQVRLLTEPVPWPASSRPRRAGISAFGISGTNAHVILEEPPAPVIAAAPQDTGPAAGPPGATGIRPAQAAAPVLTASAGAYAWPVSGKSAAALAAQAGKLAAWAAARPGLDPGAVGWSLATTRSPFEHRAVVTGNDLAAGLRALAAGAPSAQVVSGVVPPGGDPGKVVFVFPGQGSQWPDMGLELAAVSPVFAARLGECSRALEPYTGWRLEEVLAETVLPEVRVVPELERVDVVQPALWAVMVSLAAVWQAAGVVPDAVAGHSQGEIAAAVVAGVLSLDDGAKVVALRSRALSALAGRGAMASLALPAAQVRERLARGASAARSASAAHGAQGGPVQIAAVNGPNATVVSGDPAAVAALVAAVEADGVRARLLSVDYASHGPQVEELEQEIRAVLDGITPRPAVIPMISAMTGAYLDGPEADASYWYASLRAPVDFQRSVQALAGDGHAVFIEASPHPVLAAPVTDTLENLGPAAASVPGASAGYTVVGTLRRDDGGAPRLLTALAEAYVRGVPVDWARVLPPALPADLPTYAFQHRRYWPGATPRPVPATASADGTGRGVAVGTEAEARFWAAVEGGDLAGLSAVLDVDGQRPFTDVLPALASWRKRELTASAAGSWRYRTAWLPVADPGPVTLSGVWLLVVPAGHERMAADLTWALTSHGARVNRLDVGHGLVPREALTALIDEDLPGDAAEDLVGVLSLLALDDTPVPGFAEVPAGLAATTALVQALGDAEITVPLWVVTAGAVATRPDETLASPAQAQCWGLGRAVALEHPGRWGGLIDLPAGAGTAAVLDDATLGRLAVVLAGCGEDQVAVRSSGLLARRMVRAGTSRPARSVRAPSWAPSGTALVTGGTGAIGGHTARLLAARGAPRVVLTSRSGPVAIGVPALAAGLADAGTGVTVAACDSARPADLAGLLGRIDADGAPLTAVFHAAGNAPGQPVNDITAASLAGTLAVKAAGAAILDELTAGSDLEAFVLFSSGAATWGSANLGGYAAANAYLDALAENRRARGLRATSVAWGLWAGGGLGDGEAAAPLQRLGVRDMDPEAAAAALAQALDDDETTLTVADVDWERFAPVFTLRRPSPLLSELPEARQALADPVGTPPDAEEAAGLAARLAGLPRTGRDRLLTDLVRTHAAAVLGYPSPEAVEPARAFKELGIDSVTALELRNRLGAATGLTLPATLVYDHPSPSALAASLRTALDGDADADVPPLLADLRQLESGLRTAPADPRLRDEITRALHAIVSEWTESQQAGEPEDAAEEPAIAFDSATPDQVFDFLDKELGLPGSAS